MLLLYFYILIHVNAPTGESYAVNTSLVSNSEIRKLHKNVGEGCTTHYKVSCYTYDLVRLLYLPGFIKLCTIEFLLTLVSCTVWPCVKKSPITKRRQLVYCSCCYVKMYYVGIVDVGKGTFKKKKYAVGTAIYV